MRSQRRFAICARAQLRSATKGVEAEIDLGTRARPPAAGSALVCVDPISRLIGILVISIVHWEESIPVRIVPSHESRSAGNFEFVHVVDPSPYVKMKFYPDILLGHFEMVHGWTVATKANFLRLPRLKQGFDGDQSVSLRAQSRRELPQQVLRPSGIYNPARTAGYGCDATAAIDDGQSSLDRGIWKKLGLIDFVAKKSVSGGGFIENQVPHD